MLYNGKLLANDRIIIMKATKRSEGVSSGVRATFRDEEGRRFGGEDESDEKEDGEDQLEADLSAKVEE